MPVPVSGNIFYVLIISSMFAQYDEPDPCFMCPSDLIPEPSFVPGTHIMQKLSKILLSVNRNVHSFRIHIIASVKFLLHVRDLMRFEVFQDPLVFLFPGIAYDNCNQSFLPYICALLFFHSFFFLFHAVNTQLSPAVTDCNISNLTRCLS